MSLPRRRGTYRPRINPLNLALGTLAAQIDQIVPGMKLSYGLDWDGQTTLRGHLSGRDLDEKEKEWVDLNLRHLLPAAVTFEITSNGFRVMERGPQEA